MRRIVVRGQQACFAAPSGHVDRYTYPIPPNSAGRSIIGCVYDHREYYIDITKIWVLNPIRYIRDSFTQVEDLPLINIRTGSLQTYDLDRHERRVSTEVSLFDPAFMFEFEFRAMPGTNANLKKAYSIFDRRMARGELYKVPFLGLSQYRATLSLPDGTETPIQQSREFGIVLHDIDRRHDPPRQYVYDCIMVNGVIIVPSFFDLVLNARRSERRAA